MKEDPKNNIADYTGWTSAPAKLSYTIRLYKANGAVLLKEYEGTHGIVCDGPAFQHKVDLK